MNKTNKSLKLRKGMTLLALLLAVAVPFAVLAETPAAADTVAGAVLQAQAGNRGGKVVDISALTDEQKPVYSNAVALYEQIEDAVLLDLKDAGVISQVDADAYIALRTARKSLTELDKSAWTAVQYKAYYEANAKTGDERKTAMQALADAGQLTKAQADALSASRQDGVWVKISKNASTNTVIKTALSTMRQALKTLNSTLREAGITLSAKDMIFGEFGTRIKNIIRDRDNSQNKPGKQSNDGSGVRR